MISRRTIFFLLSLCFIQVTLAQPGISVKTAVDKQKILIGEPLQLTIDIYLPAGTSKKSILPDSIDHFELLEKPVIDTTGTGSALTIKGIYKLTSFDSGRWVIPSFILSPSVRSDTIPVDVVFSDFDSTQAYHDIKDILEVNPAKKKTTWWWYAAAGGLLLLLLLLYLLRRKKPLPVRSPITLVSPYEEAVKALDQLAREAPEAKQFHSRLTDIFRVYIFRKKGILSLQKTTDDLVVQLRDLDLGKEQFDKLAQSLRLSDFVKFAKYIPAAADNRGCFTEISNAITLIEKSAPGTPVLERNQKD